MAQGSKISTVRNSQCTLLIKKCWPFSYILLVNCGLLQEVMMHLTLRFLHNLLKSTHVIPA